MGRRRRGRKPKSDAPIDRFVWKDGDVIVTYDPAKDPNALSKEEYLAKRRAEGKFVPSDHFGTNPANVVRFKARRREE